MVVLAGLGDYLEVGLVHTFLEDLAAQKPGMRTGVAFGGDIAGAAAVNIGYSLELDVVVGRLNSAGCTPVWQDSSHRIDFGKGWYMKCSMEPMVQSLGHLYRAGDAAEDLEVSAGYLMNRTGFDFAALEADMLLVVPDRNTLR